MVEAVYVFLLDIFPVVFPEIYLVRLYLLGKDAETLPVEFRLEDEV